MPYESINELPDSVKKNLPKHAQEIYQAAFNNAWKQYDHDEQRAHSVAWSAVKEDYEKNENTGDWQKKE